MTRSTSPFARLAMVVMVLFGSLGAAHAQCVFFRFDDFESEGLGPPLCAVPYDVVTENWTNIEMLDETNWVPWVGDTPTGGTGPTFIPVFDPDLVSSSVFSSLDDVTISLRALEKHREAERSIDTGKYLYVESTDCCGNRAILESDTLDFSTHETVGMIFMYHMYGSTMGSLVVEVSADGGTNWTSVWEEPDPSTGWTAPLAAGPDWQFAGVNLAPNLAGSDSCLIRMTATVGPGGEHSDIALDNLFIYALEPIPTVHNEGTFDYEELNGICRTRVTFDKPSDLCPSVDHELQSADLRLDLNMGEHFRFGGTDLDGGIEVKYRLEPQGSACAFTDTFTLAITDDRHPEQLAIHDFAACYATSDWIDVYFESITVGEDPEYPIYLDDVRFDIEVDIHEHIGAHDKTVNLHPPVIPAGGGPVQFSWQSSDGADCDYPTYRFQLLRLHDFGGGTCSSGSGPRSSMSEADWTRSALTLEVGSPSVDLSMMEGSGLYAWRVMPIGDLHPGGAGNDLNWGRYSGFTSYSTAAAANPQDFCATETAVFEYTDPDEDKNRMFSRNFSRNLEGHDEILLVQESVGFKSGTGFPQQSQVLSRGQGVALAQASVRSYKGMTPLQIMPVPLEKQDLNYQPGLIRNSGDTHPYSAEHFDADTLFREPEAMSQTAAASVGRYWADEENPDDRIPSAEGYPFAAVEYTRDGTNRPLTQGLTGEVLRLRPDGFNSRIKYGSVTTEELTRIFGNEAPDASKVEKIITISPENVTTVSYVDLTGNTLATCLASNPFVDEEKFVLLTPEDGFSVTNELSAAPSGVPYLYEAQTELSFEEEMTLELDYILDAAQFQSNCLSFCRTCDHKVHIRIVDLDGPSTVFEDSILVEQETCPLGALGTTEWADLVTLDAGRYMLHYEVRLNNANGSSTYLDQAREDLAAELSGDIEAITDPIQAVLQDIIDETATLADFFDYCDAEVVSGNATAHDEDGDGTIDYYLFGLGQAAFGFGSCEDIRVDTDTCKYDCNPDTRDFEAFVTDVAGAAMYDRVYTQGLDQLEFDEYKDLSPTCPNFLSGYCLDLSDARGWFDWSGGSIDWDSPNNIAALNYDVAEGEFNQVIETMLQAHDDAPEIYDTYTCLNIYASLESISQDLLYYTNDSSIVDQLLDRLGYHYEDTVSFGAAGTFGDPSDEGFMTHPFKYVRLPVLPPATSWQTHPCFDETSAFSGYDIESLDINNADDRSVIEEAFYGLNQCLQDDISSEVDDAMADTETGVVNQENIYDRWEELCTDLIEDKAGYFEDKAHDAVAEAFSCPDGYLCPAMPLTDDELQELINCYSIAIVEYASNLCSAPRPPRTNEVFGMDDPSPIMGIGSYLVDDSQKAGTFVRHGQAEWAEFSRTGAAFETRFPLSNQYDEVTEGAFPADPTASTYLTVREMEYDLDLNTAYLSSIPTEEDIELLTAIAMGTTSLFFHPDSASDESVVIASPGDATWTRDVEIFSDKFNQILPNKTLPGSIEDVSSDWYNMHTGIGPPMMIDLDHDTCMVLRCGANDPINPTKVLGNGAWHEGYVMFPPGLNKFELELNLNFLNNSAYSSTRIDNLYVVFEDAQYVSGPYKPELPISQEALYPTEVPGRTVSVHEINVKDLISEGWQTLTSRFDFDSPYGTGHNYRLNIFMKQELHSEPVRIAVDDLKIYQLKQCIIPAELFADFTLWEPEPDETELESCDQVVARSILEKMLGEKQRILDENDALLVQNYTTNCAPSDRLTAGYSLNYYQYTLYYYDPMGRLIRTVSPAGVDTSAAFTRGDSPDHAANGTFATEYAYNGLGSLVKTSTPDAGIVNTWYDRLQRARFTQTAQDVEDNRFRYLCYDNMDRLIRSGVMNGTPDLYTHVDDLDWPEDDGDPATTGDCIGCSERVYIVYDSPMDPMPSGFDQTHLTNRISFSTNDLGDTTAYSYDSKGRVASLYQHVELTSDDFTADDALTFNHIIDYAFDPVSGNMTRVTLNEGREDQFFHRYEYDEDQRQTAAYSSTDGEIWHRDQLSEFYDHGPLKRKELGHYSVQGVDYTYNLHGQLIALNLPTGIPEEDPGQDGDPTGPRPWIARDAFAMQISQYDGDFNRSDSPFEEGESIRMPVSYYDGNIAATSWHQAHLTDDSGNAETVSHAYMVDEMNRLRSASMATLQSTGWTESTAFSTEYDYDSNSNLTHLSRTNVSGAVIDELTYVHETSTNRLNHILDAVGAIEPDIDLDNQSPNNYLFDLDGRLISNENEGLILTWNIADKLTSITKVDGEVIQFKYDARQNRTIKTIPNDQSTYTLVDALGSPLSYYHFHPDSGIVAAQSTIQSGQYNYPEFTTISGASSTPSVFTRTIGNRNLELKDYLSSVRTAIIDATNLQSATYLSEGDPTALESIPASAVDYYPYGMPMHGRFVQDSGSYRYGFNGQEKVDEILGDGNHNTAPFWEYDTRTGQRWNLDPVTVYSRSNYSTFGSNPTLYTDHKGDKIQSMTDPQRFKDEVSKWIGSTNEKGEEVTGLDNILGLIEFDQDGVMNSVSNDQVETAISSSNLSDEQAIIVRNIFAQANHTDLHQVWLLKSGENVNSSFWNDKYNISTSSDVVSKFGGGVNTSVYEDINDDAIEIQASIAVIDHTHQQRTEKPTGDFTTSARPSAPADGRLDYQGLHSVSSNMDYTNWMPGQISFHEIIGHGGARMFGGDHTDAVRMENLFLRVHHSEQWRVGRHHSEAIQSHQWHTSNDIPQWARIPPGIQEKSND